MKLSIRVETSGPLFRRNATKVLTREIKAGIQEMVEEAEDFINQRAQPRPSGEYKSRADGGTSTGNYRRNISTVVKDLVGIVHDGGVVYGPWLEGVSGRNQTTRFKGYGIFKQARELINKRFKRVMEKRLAKATRRLGG